MKIQLEDGRTLEVEGNPSPEELDGIVQSLSAPAPTQAPMANQPAGQGAVSDFVPDIKPQIPTPAQMPYGTSQAAINAANKAIEESNKYERSFIGDEERQRIKKLESERPFLSGVAEGLSNVMKNFQAGTALSPDFLPEGIQKVLDYQPFGENLPREEREKQIKEQMGRLNERYQITRHENPLATMAGETLPYLATGIAGDKGLSRIMAATENKLKNANIAVNKFLKNPDEVARIQNKPARIQSEYEQQLNTLARGSLTGAAEGAAAYDKTALEGATTAALGGVSGMYGPMRVLNKVRNERDAAGKGIIKEMYKEGFQITPGIRTGNRTLQTEEAALRNSDYYGQEFANQIDRPNQRRMTDMAGEAIGMNTKDRDLISQEELAGHMKSLSDQYKTLENNTTSIYGINEVQQVGRILKDMQPTKHKKISDTDKQRYGVLNSVAKEIKSAMLPLPTGQKFTGYQFNGSQYQALRSRIQDEISQAYTGGDKILAGKLQDMQKILDNTLTKGMDKGTAKQWKDLNERFAMSNILMKNGMTPSGSIDPRGITSAVMKDDEAARTLTGKGGRVKRFQDIARYNDVLTGKDVQGGDLTGLGRNDPAADRGLLKRAYQYATKPIDLFALSYKLNTNRLPFVGKYLSPAHGLSPTASIQLQRAMAQTETPQDYVRDAYQDLLREIRGE